MAIDLLVLAIVVFALVVAGLAFTVFEFRKM